MTENILARDVPSEKKFSGLTGNQIKLIAAAMMLMDHIHQMFIMHGVPDWFTWIGRPVAPIFLFMCAEGFYHTRSKKRYMLLLLAGFEFMSLANTFLTRIMPNWDVALINNIFGTLFLSTLYMLAADMLRDGVREKKTGKILLSVLMMLLPAAASIPALVILASPELITRMPPWLFMVVAELIPSVMLTEGGVFLVLMGLLFYLFRKNRMSQAAMLIVMSLISFLISRGIQWLMIFAVIPILLYNGKRGGGNGGRGGGIGSKYFFYVFYPAHIYLLYTAEWIFAR